MLNAKEWERACGLARTVVEEVRVDDADESVMVSVRSKAKTRGADGRRISARSPGSCTVSLA